MIECLPNIGDAQGDVRQSTAPAVLFDLLGYRRLGAQRLQQLDQVRTIADLQQHFAHLVGAQHIFAMHLLESERLVGLDMRLQLTRPHGDGHVIEKQESTALDLGNPSFKLHHYLAHLHTFPVATLTAETLPASGAVMLVSIFMASSTSRTSPT